MGQEEANNVDRVARVRDSLEGSEIIVAYGLGVSLRVRRVGSVSRRPELYGPMKEAL